MGVQVVKISEIQALLNDPKEGEFLIAEGSPAVNGKDGYISFEFDVSRKTLVRNVKAGEKIATVYPPTLGVDGFTVTGEILKAKSGKPADVAVRKMATVAVVELCAQLGYKFGMREDLFKLFFEQGKEIFERTDDLNFKVCFLKFASERIELDEVKSFIIQLLDGNGEISEKAFEIVNERAKEFILFSLKNSVDDESFINLVELALYNSKEIFEDSVLKNLVLEKLLEIFNRVGAEKKIAVLNLISSLDKVIFEEILQKVKMDSDPILKAYLMSI